MEEESEEVNYPESFEDRDLDGLMEHKPPKYGDPDAAPNGGDSNA